MFIIDKQSDKTITASVGIVHPKGRDDQYVIIKNKRGWDIPGGHLEPGESPRQAFSREVLEETGCKVVSLHESARISSDSRPTTAMSVFVAWVEMGDFIATDEIFERAVVDKKTLKELYFGDAALLSDVLEATEAPKRIAVTGGAGFVGSNLCKSLHKDGHYVICIDDLSTGRQENIASLLNEERFEFIQHDITQPLTVIVDEIYNLASPASPPQYQRRPLETMMTNVLGAYNILMLAKHMNARVLQASTSEVYGDPAMSPQNESYNGNVNPIGIRACYDEGKRAAESLFSDFKRVHNVDSVIVRIFNTYGPGMAPDDGRVISNFISQRLHNQQLTIYGDGQQTRSFMYIDDLTKALTRVMDSDYHLPINLGNPHEITIREAAKIIMDKIPATHDQIVLIDLPEDDPMQRKPDISLAQSLINWSPEVSFEEGIEKTIAYFKHQG